MQLAERDNKMINSIIHATFREGQQNDNSKLKVTYSWRYRKSAISDLKELFLFLSATTQFSSIP